MKLEVIVICPDIDCSTDTVSPSIVEQATRAAQTKLNTLQNLKEWQIRLFMAPLHGSIAKSAGVTVAPAVLVVDAATDRLLYTQTGSVNQSALRDKLVALVSQGYDAGPGDSGTGIVEDAPPGGGLLGLGLFNLPFNIPAWLWMIVAAAAAYKAATSKRTRCKVVFGSAALIAGANYLNRTKAAPMAGLPMGIAGLPPMASNDFAVNATGDVVTGDVIRFTEGVFTSGRKPSYKGDRTITARVLKDSYGADKQQHTFSLLVLNADGVEADKYPAGSKTTRKGRNIYRNGTMRQKWVDESARSSTANEKHARGDEARRQRDLRRMTEF